MSDYKLRYADDQRLRRHLLQLAAEVGWVVCDADLMDDCNWLYLHPDEGTAGTAHPNSILVCQGEAMGLDDFIRVIQKGPTPKPVMPVEIQLNIHGGAIIRIKDTGWMYFSTSTTKYAICPGDARSIVEAYNKTVK